MQSNVALDASTVDNPVKSGGSHGGESLANEGNLGIITAASKEAASSHGNDVARILAQEISTPFIGNGLMQSPSPTLRESSSSCSAIAQHDEYLKGLHRFVPILGAEFWPSRNNNGDDNDSFIVPTGSNNDADVNNNFVDPAGLENENYGQFYSTEVLSCASLYETD